MNKPQLTATKIEHELLDRLGADVEGIRMRLIERITAPTAVNRPWKSASCSVDSEQGRESRENREQSGKMRDCQK